MRAIVLVSVLATTLVACVAHGQTPLDTAYEFTYQATIADAGSPANGTYDLRFQLFNEPVNGDEVGPALCFDDVTIANGSVSQILNFGNVYQGEVLWMELSLRANGTPADCATGVYTTLAPRQQLTIAPFAGQAISALSASTASSLNGLGQTFFQNAGNVNSGTLADARLSANVLLATGNQTISGVKSFSSDIALLNDDATLTFSAADSANSPMIQMFASGTANGSRMVLAHSPTFTTTGLRYNDVSDDFEFTSAGASTLGVRLATGRLSFSDAGGGLSISTPGPTTGPFLSLFPAETNAGGRNIIAESGTDGSTSLAYDASSDTFHFLFNGGDEDIAVDVPNGRIGIGTIPQQRLDIGGLAGQDGIRFPDGSIQTTASIWRGRPSGMSFMGGNVGLGAYDPSSTLHLARDFSPNTIRFQSQQVVTGGLSSSSSSASVSVPLGTGVAWTNSANGATVNGQFATANFVFPETTNNARTLKFSNLNLNIPANATITRVTVQVTANKSGSCSTCTGPQTGLDAWSSVRLTDGTNTSPPRSSSSGVGGAYGYDGYSHTWNMVLTPAIMNSPNFAILYEAHMAPYSTYESYPSGYDQVTCMSCTATGTVSVDGAVLTVEYGAPVTASGDFSIGMAPGSANLNVYDTANLATPLVSIAPTNHLLTVNGAAAKPGGGSWSTTSDIRLKHDIQPLSGTLDTLLSLHGYSFEYNDAEVKAGRALPGRQVGLIAQEVQRVFPDWITARDDGYYTVTERATTALMVESLRDLRTEKDAGLAGLQQQINALREENNELRQRLDALERR